MLDIGFSLARLAIFLGGLLFFLALELAMPYRPPTVSKPKRWLTNLVLAGINSLVLGLVFQGAPLLVAAYVSQAQIGLLHLFSAPYWLKFLLTLAFLDFMLYVWHLLNHEVPFFWRFHVVHHTDLNMDVSTATRFHLGELAISTVIKAGLVYLLGADVYMVIGFEILLVLAAQVHHSSFRAPVWLEALMRPFLVPPSMHRVHHSVRIKERNTNYGTIFSIWDRMLGTLLRDVDQNGIIIGVGGYFDESKLGLGGLVLMPGKKYVP